jgi:CRP-like cAMP-binding protein
MPEAGFAVVPANERLQLLDGLAPQDRKRILAAAKTRRFVANSVITNQGHPADHLLLLTKGRARYFFDVERGKHILLHWLGPGDLIGGKTLLERPSAYLLSTEAVKECSVLVWNRATIRSFVAQYPILLENALSTASDYLEWYVAAHASLTCHTAEQRLASVLTSLARVIGQKVADGVELDVANEELANAANITPFTVSRLISGWQRRGSVKKSRGKLLLSRSFGLLLREP